MHLDHRVLIRQYPPTGRIPTDVDPCTVFGGLGQECCDIQAGEGPMIFWHSQLLVYHRVCGASLLHSYVGAFFNYEVPKLRVLDVALIAILMFPLPSLILFSVPSTSSSLSLHPSRSLSLSHARAAHAHFVMRSRSLVSTRAFSFSSHPGVPTAGPSSPVRTHDVCARATGGHGHSRRRACCLQWSETYSYDT